MIPYFSLASGFLTGKYRQEEDFAGAARAGGTKKYWNDRGRAILKALDEVGYTTPENWATIEMPGGDAERMKTLSRQLDQILEK